MQVLDGDKGWVRIMGKTREITGVTLTELPGDFVRCWRREPDTLLEGRSYTLTTLAGRKVGGRTAAGVRVASKGHPDIDLFFDKESGLLVASRRQSLNAEGRDVTLETTYQDYKDFEGIKVATSLVLSHDGEKVMEGKVRDIRFLEKLEKKDFMKP